MTAVEELLSVLGPDLVKVGADIPARNSMDSAGLEPQPPAALVLPRTHRGRRRRRCASATRTASPW